MKKLKSNLFDFKKYFKDSDDYEILYLEDKNGNKITSSEVENSNNYKDTFIDMTKYMKIGLLYDGKEIVLKLVPIQSKNDISYFEEYIKKFYLDDTDLLNHVIFTSYDIYYEFYYKEFYYGNGTGYYAINNKNKIISEFNNYRKNYYNELYPIYQDVIKQFIGEHKLLFSINNTDYEKELIQNLINNENFINDLSKFITNIFLNILLHVIIDGLIRIEYYYDDNTQYFQYNGPSPYVGFHDYFYLW